MNARDAVAALKRRLSPYGNAMSRGDRGRADDVIARVRRPLDRAWFRRIGAHEGLGRLGDSVQASAPPATGPKVLLLSLRSWADHNAIELAIAQGLRMRGADVTLLRCGGGQPICEQGWSRRAYPRPCDRCAWHVGEIAERSHLPLLSMGDHLPWGSDGRRAPRTPPPAGGYDPTAAAELSTAWILRSSDPSLSPDADTAGADFLVSAAGLAEAVERVLDRVQPDVVFAINGLFAAERAMRDIALARGIRVPTYEMAPKQGAILLSHTRPAADNETDAGWELYGGTPLRDEQRAAVQRLLDDRVAGAGLHEVYFHTPEGAAAKLREELAIPAGRKVASLFTNLSWDSATIGKHVAFGSMFDWIEHAVRAAAEAPDTVLVVRVHPAESRWKSLEETEAILRERVGALPENVRLIRPDQQLSSYALLEISDLVCVYATTVGLEAATRGLPVAVAGLTHYRGRGFTHDVERAEQLTELLRRPPARDEERVRELALRYAYTYFFRICIPFTAVGSAGGLVQRVPQDAAEVAPGGDRYVGFVCDRILDGDPFVLPDELVPREAGGAIEAYEDQVGVPAGAGAGPDA